ncbi:OmpA family protein [Falsiroseomonas selenitidurans]|uniref:OmpA family protein n=1 Tax=Falsiroseomonas selenitidurans TaxID=2716335 RepID=A0ABX1E2J3_9PROT|nr:OmpA family protein [Falsiroseomonas selenitidurans]NKC29737.1 OmpA family protein [Falsiroseomonas selenitidurans]
MRETRPAITLLPPLALLLAATLPPAQAQPQGCRAEVEALIRAVEKDAAWPRVEAAFTKRSGRALVLALRGDEDGCLALLAESRQLLAAEGIAPVPPAPLLATPPGPATIYRFGAEADGTTRRYTPAAPPAGRVLDLTERDRVANPGAGPAAAVLVAEVGFGFDESRLTSDAEARLRQVAETASRLRNPLVLLTGHADTFGNADYNLRLSARRVAAVRAALRRLGVPEDALRSREEGEARPEVRRGDGVREAANRRVEIRVLDGG